MGMVMGLTSLTDANIERLLADPPLVWTVVAPDDPELYEQSRREKHRKPGLLARLFGAKPPDLEAVAGPVPPMQLGEDEGDAGYLDKAWHGIHYLLTGRAWEAPMPLGFLVSGGRAVGYEDLGYGSPRCFSAAEVRGIASALEGLSDEELRGRFDPESMMKGEVYPQIWDRDPEEDDTLGYLMEYVAALRTAVATAAQRGHGLMITLS